MTPTSPPLATTPVIRAMLDKAREKHYRCGVLGVRARPEVADEAFDHHGVPVRVVACPSALAVREALLERDPAGWLVILTDRDETDLGHGLLGRLVWQRLRQPDPWDAVRQRFAAAGLDPALTSGPGHRDLASGLLAATPAEGWPPAPAGVLTRDHALGAVARARLGLAADSLEIDTAAVLEWTLSEQTAVRIVDLRSLAGHALVDAVLDWAAGRTGIAAAPLQRLMRDGAVGDAVPLGLVVALLVAARDSGGASGEIGRDALVRLEARLDAVAKDLPVLRAWGAEATIAATGLLHRSTQHDTARRILDRADALLRELRAEPLAAESELLPAGLTHRLGRLAEALRATGDAAAKADTVDGVLVPADRLTAVERAWEEVETHRLAAGDDRLPAMHAAVRLTRWLGTTSEAGPELAGQLARYRDVDAWADSAIADAAVGVGEAALGAALSAVLGLAGRRRDAHNREFAAALAAHTADDPAPERAGGWRRYRGVRHLEDLLPDVVLPLTGHGPVLLLVMDGMSMAVAAEVTADVMAAAGWSECLLPGEQSRAAAVAVLPSLTQTSRASLLCGELADGGQERERRGYAELTRAYGLPGAALFHKKELDSTEPGHAIAHDVAAAIDDHAGQPLVTCVLNTIDDALDRADPGGTDWRQEAIKHLRPLLDRARQAGRTVVLTSDHGHVIERRAGRQQPHPGISSGRSRPGDGAPAGAGEVLVTGRRVLRHDHSAVLAVDERLRYGPLKAGYHGGAAPAEVVVPICVLVPSVPEGSDLRTAGLAGPSWWYAPSTDVPAGIPAAAPARPAWSATRYPATRVPKQPEPVPTLFDTAPAGADAVAKAVLGSPVFREQRAMADRLVVTDDQLRQLLIALLAAPDRRLRRRQVAALLQVPAAAVPGAVAQAGRVFNVDGYRVVSLDPDGDTVVLDEPLLREQFEVSR